MITVEELLEAFSLAYDMWLDPEAERENPVPEYAVLIRRAVSAENDALRELVRDMWRCISHIGEYDVFYYDMAKDGCGISCTVNGEHCCADKLYDRMRELGVDE